MCPTIVGKACFFSFWAILQFFWRRQTAQLSSFLCLFWYLREYKVLCSRLKRAFHEHHILFQFIRILLPCISPPYVFRPVTKCHRFILASLMDLSKVPCFWGFFWGGGKYTAKYNMKYSYQTRHVVSACLTISIRHAMILNTHIYVSWPLREVSSDTENINKVHYSARNYCYNSQTQGKRHQLPRATA